MHHAARLLALVSLVSCGGIAVLEDRDGRGAGSGSGGSSVVVGASSVAVVTGTGGDPIGSATTTVGSTAVSSGDGGSAGAGGSPPDPPDITDVFDPAEVYLVGTLVEGDCDFGAIAHWSTPNVAVTGLDCDFDSATAQIRPTDGRIIYKRLFEHALRTLTCDACPYDGEYPPSPSDNDPTSSLAPCRDSVDPVSFRVSPDGDVLHGCPGTGWYDAEGNLVNDRDPGPLGYDGLALHGFAVVEWRTGVEVLSSSDGPLTQSILALRAVPAPGAFFFASDGETEDPDDAELWRIDLEVGATWVGAYPPLPPEVEQTQYWTSELDGNGVLFQLAWGADARDLIVRREVGGTSEIVYDEADDPLVKAHASFLVTGP